MKNLVLILPVLVATVFAQRPPQTPMTNAKVGDLVLAGVSQAEVIRIIASAPAINFDLNPGSTDALLKIGVSEEIIKAMAAREAGQPIAQTSTTEPAPTPKHSVQEVVKDVATTPTNAPASSSVQVHFVNQAPVTISSHDAKIPNPDPKSQALPASGFSRIPPNSRFYIEPNAGFDTFLTAALDRKHVPIAVVADPGRAEYVVESANDTQKAGWARLLALGQTGSNEEASVRIVKVGTGDVVWAYAVHKRNSVHGKQSSAEACAKHLKSVVRQ